jgi:hypothetical protein
MKDGLTDPVPTQQAAIRGSRIFRFWTGKFTMEFTAWRPSIYLFLLKVANALSRLATWFPFDAPHL